MGFGGGGSNVTKAHTHDGAVVQDGGSLAANATQFGLTNGSLLYSDGTNIQELGVGASGYVLGTASGTVPTWEASAAAIVMNVNGQMVYFDGSRTALDIGSTNDVLTVSGGGLPTWAAPAGGGSMTLIDYTAATADTTTIDTTFTNIPGDDMTELYCVSSGCNGGFAIDVQIYDEGSNLLTNANYTNHGYTITSGTQTIINSTGDDHWAVVPGAFEPHYAIMHITLGRCGTAGVNYQPRIQTFSSGTSGVSHIGGTYGATPRATGISGIKFGISGSNSIQNGTYLAIYQVKNV
jgi:hypothetical protein